MSVGKSDLDQSQIIQAVYDDTNNCLQVSIVGGATNQNVNINDSAGNPLNSTAGSLNVDVTNFPATQPVSGTVTVTQATGTNLHTVVDSGNVTATISGTPNVAVTSSVLPTGASTSTNQTTANTSLSAIQTSVANIPAQGQALAAASTPVVLTAAQITTLTPLASVTVTQATGTNLHAVIDSSALPTGAATSSLQTSGNASLSTIATNTTGVSTAANQTTANISLATIATNTTPILTPSAFFSGQKTSTGTAVAITTSQAIQNGVIVQALSTNVNSVYIGPTGVTSSTGMELQPGQATSIGVNNLSTVFIISTNSGDGICFIGS